MRLLKKHWRTQVSSHLCTDCFGKTGFCCRLKSPVLANHRWNTSPSFFKHLSVNAFSFKRFEKRGYETHKPCARSDQITRLPPTTPNAGGLEIGRARLRHLSGVFYASTSPEPVVPSDPSSQAWLKCFYTPKHPHVLKLPKMWSGGPCAHGSA